MRQATPRKQASLLIQILLLSLLIFLTTPFAFALPQDEKPGTDDPTSQGPFAPTTPTRGNGSSLVCILGYEDCSTIGRRDACCSLTQVCTFDENGNVGCCEFGVKCVGEIPRGTNNNSGAGPVGGGTVENVLAVMVWSAAVAAGVMMGIEI